MNVDAYMKRLKKMASSKKSVIKNNYPHILLVGDQGCREDVFVNSYTELVSSKSIIENINYKYPVIKLKFPVNGTHLDILKFLSSPDMYARAVSTNRYRGVFYIDLTELNKYEIGEDSIQQLINYILNNSDGIKFIIYVNTCQGVDDELLHLLNSITIEKVVLNAPEVDECVEYIESKLLLSDIMLDDTAVDYLRDVIVSAQDNDNFTNYRSLDMMASNIIKELYIQGVNIKGKLSVSAMELISDRIFPQMEYGNNKVKLGF